MCQTLFLGLMAAFRSVQYGKMHLFKVLHSHWFVSCHMAYRQVLCSLQSEAPSTPWLSLKCSLAGTLQDGSPWPMAFPILSWHPCPWKGSESISADILPAYQWFRSSSLALVSRTRESGHSMSSHGTVRSSLHAKACSLQASTTR